MKKILVLWLAHHVWDSRIFYKQALSLSKKFKVKCLWWAFAQNKWKWIDEKVENVWISWNRLLVLFNAINFCFKNKSDIYIAHDLDSYFVSVIIKCFKWKSKIVFDSHEYYDEMWKDQQYVMLHRIVYFLFSKFLKPITLNLFSWVVVISELMKEHYRWNYPKEIIYNFPLIDLLDENFKLDNPEKYNDKFILIYQWWLIKIRGILEYIKILNLLKKDIPNIYLILVWWFKDKNYENELKKYIEKNWLDNYVEFTWKIPLVDVYSYDKISHVGLNLLESNYNNDNGIQIKMFEYLYLELPSLWTNTTKYYNHFITNNWCGEWINSIKEIDEWVEMIKKIKENYDSYKSSCRNNKNKYIWRNEEVKLIKFYNKIINEK